MNPSSLAIGIILLIAVVGTLVGVRAGAGRKRSLEEWSVAGRSFGVVFVWLLMAGEIYTTFSSARYRRLGLLTRRTGALHHGLHHAGICEVSFYVLPYVWEIAQRHGLQTQPDFFAWCYRSKFLAMFVSVAGILFVIPYLQLQLTGLGIIVQVASFDAISRNASMMVAIALIAFFVFIGGMRAVAWVSILKDSLIVTRRCFHWRVCSISFFWRHVEPDVPSACGDACKPYDHAGRNQGDGPFLVHHNGTSECVRLLYVAAHFQRFSHCKKQ